MEDVDLASRADLLPRNDVGEWYYGPIDELPNSRPHRFAYPTPDETKIWHEPDFLTKLDLKLNNVSFVHHLRCVKYGTAVAEEYLDHHTPQELRDEWTEKRRKASEEWDRTPSPTPDCSLTGSCSSTPLAKANEPQTPATTHSTASEGKSYDNRHIRQTRIMTEPRLESLLSSGKKRRHSEVDEGPGVAHLTAEETLFHQLPRLRRSARLMERKATTPSSSKFNPLPRESPFKRRRIQVEDKT